jgi:hypothetical protein
MPRNGRSRIVGKRERWEREALATELRELQCELRRAWLLRAAALPDERPEDSDTRDPSEPEHG